MKLIPAAYRGLFAALSKYWSDYGGWSDFLKSPLLHLSVFITATSYGVWKQGNWQDLPLSLLPNLLGFSLGAYALIFTLANERLLHALSMPNSGGAPTFLSMINATYLHFIMVQTTAIVFALFNKSSFVIELVSMIPPNIIDVAGISRTLVLAAAAFGYWLTVYSVVLLIGAALATYRLAIMSGRAAAAQVNSTTSNEARQKHNEQ